MTIFDELANSVRTGSLPTTTEGSTSVGRSAPASATRPPSTTRGGITEVMVGTLLFLPPEGGSHMNQTA
jgi:hypothetical protein